MRGTYLAPGSLKEVPQSLIALSAFVAAASYDHRKHFWFEARASGHLGFDDFVLDEAFSGKMQAPLDGGVDNMARRNTWIVSDSIKLLRVPTKDSKASTNDVVLCPGSHLSLAARFPCWQSFPIMPILLKTKT